MRTGLFNLAVKGTILLGIVYLLSNGINKGVISSIIFLIIALFMVRWVLRTAISLLLTLIKWICIIGVISLVLSSI